jgi:hypothetical protein
MGPPRPGSMRRRTRPAGPLTGLGHGKARNERTTASETSPRAWSTATAPTRPSPTAGSSDERTLVMREADGRVSATAEASPVWTVGAAYRDIGPETLVPLTNDPAADPSNGRWRCATAALCGPCGRYGTAIGAVGTWGGRLLRSPRTSDREVRPVRIGGGGTSAHPTGCRPPYGRTTADVTKSTGVRSGPARTGPTHDYDYGVGPPSWSGLPGTHMGSQEKP